ncbi:type IVB secretion system protein IcmH/DotU [Candidatus Sneabacter namystus]|uniref:DotU family type IV/VI secretion system protein n=1 Tax=Candidatus Sneabacter namystus TaxID=2601646 RepID=A0A5C0ULX7_9RICK|nr:type IVB secretion system protein IcmH/DotU [Candidatus Sneabacter namystus]QEK39904.1 DotU family type IV/VI secretion system protein [Candidatus Sneabacter namystus]
MNLLHSTTPNIESTFEQENEKVWDKTVIITLATKEIIYICCILNQALYAVNLSKLYALLIHKMEDLTTSLVENNFSNEEITKIRYMLCAALDEATGVYARKTEDFTAFSRSLIQYYYKENTGGEKIFNILETTLHNPIAYLPISTLGYIILATGFKGKYAISENGLTDLSDIKDRIFYAVKRALSIKEKHKKTEKQLPYNAILVKSIIKKIVPTMAVVIVIVYLVSLYNIEQKKKQLHLMIKESLEL